MTLLLFLKSKSSRNKVNDVKHCQEEFKEFYYKEALEHGGDDASTSLTVWGKSLLMNCNGFTVIDSNGNHAYRVDNYCVRPAEIVLMDGAGVSILTMRRQKTMRLVDDWIVYNGDICDKFPKTCQKKQPICYVKKNVNLLQAKSNVRAHVFVGPPTKNPTYVIEGSYGQRSCKIFDKTSKKIVAEIKRKEARNGCGSFGPEVFQLIVWPGFNSGLAMTLVLLLDQMFS